MIRSKLGLAAIAAGVGMLVAGTLIFVYAPPDALQGQVQRIFYLHVASAFGAYLCFALVLIGSVGYLWRRSERADRLARAAAPVGLVFTSTCLVMGSLWAKPIWGTFWTWDARLTSTLVLWIIYAGYLLVRRLATSPTSAARLGAVVGIFGFIDVPVVQFSVEWWRTLHPGPVLESTNPALPPAMLFTFIVTFLAVLLLASVLVALRYQLELLRERVAAYERQRIRAGESTYVRRPLPVRPEPAP